MPQCRAWVFRWIFYPSFLLLLFCLCLHNSRFSNSHLESPNLSWNISCLNWHARTGNTRTWSKHASLLDATCNLFWLGILSNRHYVMTRSQLIDIIAKCHHQCCCLLSSDHQCPLERLFEPIISHKFETYVPQLGPGLILTQNVPVNISDKISVNLQGQV